MSTTDLPGAGLSYADLCNSEGDSDIRETWTALLNVAQMLGLPTSRQGGGSKTLDQLVEEINEALPEGSTIDDVILASLRLAHSREAVTYEVMHFREVGDHWEWVPFAGCDNRAEAENLRDSWVEQNGEPYIVVAHTKTDIRKVSL